jgi:RimJ/RimL family protein N-acetyltransferase
MLKGKKVVLRPVKRSDIDHFLRWFNDPEVMRFHGAYLPMTKMAEEKWIEDLATSIPAGKEVVFVIEALDDNNKAIGNIGLHRISPKDRCAEFGISIGEKSHWGKGYGTEATRLIIDYGFNQLNLHRISSGAFAFNERSIRMQKAVGFQEEGRQREIMFNNGEFHDLVLFGLLRDEWKGS